MRPPGLPWLLVAIFVAATPASGQTGHAPVGGATSPEVVARQLAEMNHEARQAWSTSILRRLHRANLALYNTSDVSRLYTRNKQVLQHALSSTPTAPQALRWILAELDRVETEAIVKLAKEYWKQIDRVFAAKSGEGANRKAAWGQVVAAWQAAGSPVGQRGDLVLWLTKAKRNVTPLLVQPLPKTPEFHPEQTASRLAETQPPGTTKSRQTPTERARPAPSTTAARMDKRHGANGQPANNKPSSARASLPPPEPAPALFQFDKVAASAIPSGEKQPVGLDAFLPEKELWRAFTPRIPRSHPRSASLQPDRTRMPPTVNRSSTFLRGLVESLWSMKIPEVSVSKTAENSKPVSAPDSPAARPVSVAHQEPELAPTSNSPLSVTVDELAPLIAGYNLELQSLESELDDPRQWNARNLTPLVARLRELVVRRIDLVVFYNLLPEDDRLLVGELENPRFFVAELARKIVEARLSAKGSEFSGTEAARARELHDLDELSRQLGKMVSGE